MCKVTISRCLVFHNHTYNELHPKIEDKPCHTHIGVSGVCQPLGSNNFASNTLIQLLRSHIMGPTTGPSSSYSFGLVKVWRLDGGGQDYSRPALKNTLSTITGCDYTPLPCTIIASPLPPYCCRPTFTSLINPSFEQARKLLSFCSFLSMMSYNVTSNTCLA
jgi:hypothetical protein